jgi:hypothetical protein
MTSHVVPAPGLDDDHAETMVKHIYSVKLTPIHVDVTDGPVIYAAPKKFGFVSKKQMRWMDANRRCRQATKNATPVEDITPNFRSIDNREVPASPAHAREEFVRLDSAVKLADAHLRQVNAGR